jgi:hypothetical protein
VEVDPFPLLVVMADILEDTFLVAAGVAVG